MEIRKLSIEEQEKIPKINVGVISDGLVIDSAVFAAGDYKTAQEFLKQGVWDSHNLKPDDVEPLPEWFGIGDKFYRTENTRLRQAAGWYKRISPYPFNVEKYNTETGQSDMSEFEEEHEEAFVRQCEYYQQQCDEVVNNKYFKPFSALSEAELQASDLPESPPRELPPMETWIPFDAFMKQINANKKAQEEAKAKHEAEQEAKKLERKRKLAELIG